MNSSVDFNQWSRRQDLEWVFRGIALSFILFVAGVFSARGESLQEFFKLNDKLPQAVCDESVISRPPTLEPLKQQDWSGYFEVRTRIQEAEIIRFMLGDALAWVASPRVDELFRQALQGGEARTSQDRLTAIKRKISLEVCTALVTPGKFEQIFSSKPLIYLEATPFMDFKKVLSVGSGLALFKVSDPEGRFAKFKKQWWIPGWLDFQEVDSVWVENRQYRRLFHPVTLRTELIGVLNAQGIPMGFLYVTKDPASVDLKAVQAQALSEANRQRQREAYRLLIENEAYAFVKRYPKQSASVGKLQNSFKLKLRDLESRRSQVEREAHFDVADLLARLRSLSINGSYASIGLFYPDAKLQGTYEEFRKALAHLGHEDLRSPQ